MTEREAAEKLRAYHKCQTLQVKGIYEDCNEKLCDNCDLCYMQGTAGEHIKSIEMAIQALEKQIAKKPIMKPYFDDMCSCDYVGFFMDFMIYKSFETTEDNIVVPKFTGKIFYGGIQFQCSTLEDLVTKIVKYEYLNNPYYECLLYNLTKDIKNEKEGD